MTSYCVLLWVLLGLAWIIIRLSGDIHANPGPKRDFNVLYANVRGLFGNRKELKATSTQYDLVLCSETIVSDYRHSAELLLPDFNKPWLIRRDAQPRARGMSVYVRSGFTASRQKDAECGCHEVMVIRVCSQYKNFYIFSCYRNPDLNDGIYDCLRDSMAAVQERDVKSCFIFVGDFNAHHREWLESRSPTDRHGIAAWDFTNETGCTQLVAEPTHISGNRLDLFITDVPGICRVTVEPQIGSSDHFAVSAKVVLNAPIPDLTISKRVLLKSRANWEAMSNEVQAIVWREVFGHESPVDKLNSIVSDIISRHIPSKVIKMRSNDRPWFSDECRAAFNRKQAAYHRWARNRTPELWEEYRLARNFATRTFNRAEMSFNSHLKEKLAQSRNSHTWWKNLKLSLFGVHQAVSPLKKADGSLTYNADEKAQLLANHFDSKMSRDNIEIPSGCYPLPKLSTIAFRSSELLKTLQNLDEYGGIDPNGAFPNFFKTFSDLFAPKLAVLFRKLIQSGNFPNCWKLASITPIPKEGS